MNSPEASGATASQPRLRTPHERTDAAQEPTDDAGQPESRVVPNTGKPDNDGVLSPTMITVPMVLIENSNGDRYWHPEPMDHSTAKRFAESLECHHAGSATVFYVPIVMPMGSDVDDMISKFQCEPLRAKITETPITDPFAIVAERIKASAVQKASQAATADAEAFEGMEE